MRTKHGLLRTLAMVTCWGRRAPCPSMVWPARLFGFTTAALFAASTVPSDQKISYRQPGGHSKAARYPGAPGARISGASGLRCSPGQAPVDELLLVANQGQELSIASREQSPLPSQSPISTAGQSLEAGLILSLSGSSARHNCIVSTESNEGRQRGQRCRPDRFP